MNSFPDSTFAASSFAGANLTAFFGNALGLSVSGQPEQIGDVIAGPGGQTPLKPFRLKTLTTREKEYLEDAKKYIMEQNVKSVLKKQSINMQQNQLSQIKRTQALMLLSRIYVGSISYEITEDILRTAFSPFGPIKSVSLSWDPITHKHKGFCFLEYELPEAAQLALDQMNGMPMGGRNLKVGRPSNIPQAQPIIDEIIGEAKLFNRIYVCSVHPDLTEEDLRTVFEAFGTITYCKLTPDNAWSTKKHRGFGYIEYETAQSAMDAVNSMNMFDLGGQLLRVGRAITPPSALLSSASRTVTGTSSTTPSLTGSPGNKTSALPTAAAIAAASITAQVIALEAGNFSPNDGNTAASPPLPPPAVVIPKLGTRSNGSSLDRGSRKDTTCNSGWDDEEHTDNNGPSFHLQEETKSNNNDTRVVLLRNMVDEAEIDDELENEVKEECETYGFVKQVVIKCFLEGVKIFVLFDDSQSVAKAIDSLNGRYFAAREIIAEPYNESWFFGEDFTH